MGMAYIKLCNVDLVPEGYAGLSRDSLVSWMKSHLYVVLKTVSWVTQCISEKPIIIMIPISPPTLIASEYKTLKIGPLSNAVRTWFLFCNVLFFS